MQNWQARLAIFGERILSFVGTTLGEELSHYEAGFYWH